MERTLPTLNSSTVDPSTLDPSTLNTSTVDPSTLHRLLDAELDYSPQATGYFINHLAMALVAAHRLGADDAELEGWYRAQANDGYLVARERPEWLESDAAQIAERGIEATLSERLPALIGAPSAQFFHAIIRLELAVDAGHPGQVANALRNWTEVNTPIAAMPAGQGSASFADVLALIVTDAQDLSGAATDLGRVAGVPRFAQALDQLRVHDGLLDEVATAVIAHHTEPGDFGTLHLVTGTRAARSLVGFLDRPSADELALRTAQAVAAALASFGRLTGQPDLASADRPETSTTPSSWDEISLRASTSRDAHAAKLVYACRLEEAATGDPTYRAIAARQVGL
ncbi:MAG: questin oxidase family protein [Acidimicrobiales bacterium]|nr:questin oxidase family protein [Acidimicrobiales bacterium]